MDRFIRQVRLHFEGPMQDIDDNVKLWYLLLQTSITGQEISNTFSFRHNEDRTLKTYIKYFRQYVSKQSHFYMSRHKLLQCWQNSDELAHSFLKRLHQIAYQCEYEQVIDDTLVVNLFIFGIYLKSAQKSLIKEGSDLTIAKVLHIAEMEEATCKQVEVICVLFEGNSTHAVESKSKRKLTQCEYCGRDCSWGECPARWETCIICNKKRHFMNVCCSKK